MKGHRIINLGDPINGQDAGNKGYIDTKIAGAGGITTLTDLGT